MSAHKRTGIVGGLLHGAKMVSLLKGQHSGNDFRQQDSLSSLDLRKCRNPRCDAFHPEAVLNSHITQFRHSDNSIRDALSRWGAAGSMNCIRTAQGHASLHPLLPVPVLLMEKFLQFKLLQPRWSYIWSMAG